MQTFTRFFILLLSLLIISCGGEEASTSTLPTPPAPTTESTPPPVTQNTPSTHDCKISGEVLEGNQIWLRDLNTLIAIVADSTTYDPDLGDSHRVLKIYNTTDCSLTKRVEMPINISPDYAYYLAKVNYNNLSKLIGIMAFNSVYLYDMEQQKLLDSVQPTYLSKRNLDDANSGLIQHLELWENYLVGYAQDGGSFVIDVNDKNNPTATPAYAEYQLEDGTYTSLFLLPGNGNEQQIIMPSYDYEEGHFEVNPIFERPRDLNTQISKGVRNNRFIILRENDNTQPAIVIDLVEHKKMDVPADIAKQQAKKILEWAKGNS